MKKFLEFLLSYFWPDDRLDMRYELARRAYDAEEKARLIARDYAIELAESAKNQLEADIFQQALTNAFSEDEINRFFDEADKLRKEHEKNSNRISN